MGTFPPSNPNTTSLNESSPAYYGWRVVLAAHFGVMMGFGCLFVYTFSSFVKPLAAQFGWSRESISQGFAFGAIMVAVWSPLIGRCLDRFGPRRIILPCMTVFGAGIASLALLRPHLWQFYATCILLGAVGNGAAHLAYSRSISTWFSRRLGLAFALVMAGSGIGSIILPLVAESVTVRAGWRAAYLVLGLLALLVALPLSWRYVHDRPQVHCVTQKGAPPSGLTWRQGIRRYAFWFIVIALFASSISTNGAITHLVAMLTDRGITPRSAALALSVLGATSVAGRLAVGTLLDRLAGSLVAFLNMGFSATGILLLAHARSFPSACLAAGLMGIGLGGEADVTPYLLTRYFGLRAFSTLYGLTWTFYAIAGAIGPVILGRAFDLTGSYTSLLRLLGLVMLPAAGLMLFLPRYPQMAKAEVAMAQQGTQTEEAF
jgi:MFS family permease